MVEMIIWPVFRATTQSYNS